MLAALTDVITEVVAKGDRVTLVGFGTFERRNRNARETNNPQKPGEKIKVQPKKCLHSHLERVQGKSRSQIDRSAELLWRGHTVSVSSFV